MKNVGRRRGLLQRLVKPISPLTSACSGRRLALLGAAAEAGRWAGLEMGGEQSHEGRLSC